MDMRNNIITKEDLKGFDSYGPKLEVVNETYTTSKE